MKKHLMLALFALALLAPGTALAMMQPNPFAGDYTGNIHIVGEGNFSPYALTLGTDLGGMTFSETSGYLFVPAPTDTGVIPSGPYDMGLFSGSVNTSLGPGDNQIHYKAYYEYPAGSQMTFEGTLSFYPIVLETSGLSVYQAFCINGTITNSLGTATTVSGSFARATPIPGAIWLLGSGMVGLIGLRRKMGRD